MADQQFRETSLSLLILGILAAGAAVLTGHFAEEAAERSGIPKQAIEIHEELGGSVFWIFLGLLGVQLASFWGWGTRTANAGADHRPGRRGLLLLIASYFGGDLVYRFGAGVLPR
ncbi:MAG: hypothetical protein IPM88_20865 [Nitrospira sp.]|nr:hypothetical protein [Nitrospira sp.]